MITIVNLTPHELNIHADDGTITTIAPSGAIARVSQQSERIATIDGIAIARNTYGAVEGLPEPKFGSIYVVSALVLQRTKRTDVFAPGEAVRDDAGRIVGCRGLSVNPDANGLALSRTLEDYSRLLEPVGDSLWIETSGSGLTARQRVVPALHYDPQQKVYCEIDKNNRIMNIRHVTLIRYVAPASADSPAHWEGEPEVVHTSGIYRPENMPALAEEIVLREQSD